jgi:hypothetical protein
MFYLAINMNAIFSMLKNGFLMETVIVFLEVEQQF